MENTDLNIVKEIERLVNNANCNVIEVEGRKFLTGEVTEIKANKEPTYRPDLMEFNDLDSLSSILHIEYKKQPNPWLIQIRDEGYVKVLTELDDKQDRICAYEARKLNRNISLGQWQGYETFIINLRSNFVATPERDALIKQIASIKNVNDETLRDDGVTQTVIVQKGTILANQEVKSIIKLRPYRTFIEVEQPESEFLFRISKDQYALFEADGGAWRNDARKIIANYLKDKVKDLPVTILS